MTQRIVFVVATLLLTPALWAEPVCQITNNVIETVESCIPGAKAKAIAGPIFGDTKRKYFDVSFPQPVDHNDPAAGTFTQRVILAHRGYKEPMVLQTSGYSIFNVAPAAITTRFDTNQIQVEHRFFRNSTPANPDWSKLDIKQSADDFHRITTAFRKLYPVRWVNTGASKGGMTSVYHRYFYPQDLEGTVADVAPLSFSNEDERYVDFIYSVGGEDWAGCRAQLQALQEHLLKNREKFQGKVDGSYTFLGSKDLAFEHAVQELTFYFWQYGNPKDAAAGCDAVPSPDDSGEKGFAFFNRHNPMPRNYGDEGLKEFIPYYYQAASELGSPTLGRAGLDGLLKYTFSVDQYAPKGVTYSYSNASMIDVGEWVREKGERMMFVYGELDPWTAGMFPQKVADDCHWYTVDGGNHGANFTKLEASVKKDATDVLARWLGKKPTLERGEETGPSLEDLDFVTRGGTL